MAQAGEHGDRHHRAPGLGARLLVIGNNPARAHGLAVGVAILDEMAQWDPGKRDRMLATLATSAGTIPGSRLVAIGTRPADPHHPFERMLSGPRAVTFAASEEDDPMAPATWWKANPSAQEPEFAELRATIEREAAEAARDPLRLAGFQALRLNMGRSEAQESVLLDAADWLRIETEDPPVRSGPYVLGVDIGGGAAMSACAAYWPDSGDLEAFAGFPAIPTLEKRGLHDGVGGLYLDMAVRGELIQSGSRVPDVAELFREAMRRWGVPSCIVSDHYKSREVRQGLEEARVPRRPYIRRGMGWKHGSEDCRAFRAACLGGRVRPQRSLLMRSALRAARVSVDTSGNWKLAKKAQGGRRELARDDALAAAVLGVAEGVRRADRPRRGLRIAVAR